jgi:glutamate-1-semialdehyde 2,1-aminomutase
MALTRTRTQELFQRAKKSFPYGVNSNFRYWGEEETNVFVRGEKCYVFDADENRYIDYRLGFGPVILGHGYPAVVDRVTSAIKDGTVYAATHPLEISVAERIKRLTGLDKVRFANSGTEATMHALRIARAHTNREKFIKFEGTYHGMYDYALFSTTIGQARSMGSRRSPIRISSSSGIPYGIGEYVFTLPYNDLEMLRRTVKGRWGEIAAIMVEPLMGNNASVMPEPGFLELMRELCSEYGIVLIVDEVKTGFRIANGGAQQYFHIKADLATYAKSIANGFPLAAIAGTDEIMSVIQPGRVAVGGTYCGNIPGTAAADATLELLETQPVLETIAKRGRRLMDGISKILTEANILHALMGPPQMFGFVLGSQHAPTNYRDALDTNMKMYESIMMEMIQRGAMPEPDNREPWFLCYDHTDEVIDETLNIFYDSVKAVIRKGEVAIS